MTFILAKNYIFSLIFNKNCRLNFLKRKFKISLCQVLDICLKMCMQSSIAIAYTIVRKKMRAR